jgi:hypothetical protein
VQQIKQRREPLITDRDRAREMAEIIDEAYDREQQSLKRQDKELPEPKYEPYQMRSLEASAEVIRDPILLREVHSALERLSEKSARIEFKLLRDRLSATEWRPESLQEGCSYTWNSEDVAGTTIAELAERCIQGKTGFLLNFSPSRFPSVRCIPVEKAATTTITLDSVSTESGSR